MSQGEVNLERLTQLAREPGGLFGAACCERLSRPYELFVAETKWGDWNSLTATLERAWAEVLERRAIPEAERSAMIELCERNAPDSEQFDSLLVSSAQSFAIALSSLLSFLAAGEAQHLESVANCPIDALDLYVQELEDMNPQDPDREERIRKHPLMQRELSRQARIWMTSWR